MKESTVLLNKKIAIITGGSYGLGAAIAEKLGESGFHIAIIGRSEDKLKEQNSKLEKRGIKCVWAVCDVSKWNEVTAAVNSIKEKLGAPSVLVNNAGGWLGQK